MISYVVGKISDGSFVKHEGPYNTGSTSLYPSFEEIRSNVSDQIGIDESDLFVLSVTDSAIIARLVNRDSFTILWDSEEITGLDFSPEDNKLFIKFEQDKKFIASNGTDSATITVTIYESDGSTIKPVNVTKIIEGVLNGVPTAIHLDFVNGIAERIFAFDSPSNLEFPDSDRYDDFKLSGRVQVVSYL